MYEMTLKRRWGWWEWKVWNAGRTLVFGREVARSTARYKAARALFQLLLTAPIGEASPNVVRHASQNNRGAGITKR